MTNPPGVTFTKKQAEFMAEWARGRLPRITILSGSVRSGKTWISLVLWAFWVATRPADGVYMMTGRTLETLNRNCLRPLQRLVGPRNFKYTLRAKHGVLFGRQVDFEGVNDARSEGKIRGATLWGAYCDELSLFPRDFFEQLLSRLSPPGSKLIATTNPDTPTHWLYVNFMQRGLDSDLPPAERVPLRVYTFLIDDNTTLPAEYIEAEKRSHVGVFYERMILGLWVVAEGAIYRIFAENRDRYRVHLAPLNADGVPVPDDGAADYDYIQIGLDFGGTGSRHSITATGLKWDYSKVTVLCTRRLDAEGTDPVQLYDWAEQFVQYVKTRYSIGGRMVKALYADSAEQTLINGLKNRLRPYSIPVRDSIKNQIIDRIRATLALMAQGRFFIMEDDCQTLEDALCTAVWNSKKIGKTERLDDGTSDIDSLDSMEYSFENGLRKYSREA